VFAVRPVTEAATETALVPDPGEGVHVALEPYEFVGPYSSLHAVTSPPLGFTLAFRIADVSVSEDAFSVMTVGRFGAVLNVSSAPLLVPEELVATIRKW
jgi:hypothetical protein